MTSTSGHGEDTTYESCDSYRPPGPLVDWDDPCGSDSYAEPGGSDSVERFALSLSNGWPGGVGVQYSGRGVRGPKPLFPRTRKRRHRRKPVSCGFPSTNSGPQEQCGGACRDLYIGQGRGQWVWDVVSPETPFGPVVAAHAAVRQRMGSLLLPGAGEITQ